MTSERRRLRLAVTGNEGQLVRSLIERAPADIDVIRIGRPALDLACPESIAPALQAARPDALVNAAAYTAVDKAESEPELAWAINATGAGVLAEAAEGLGIPLVQVSTDYVFDGRSAAPYDEDDTTGPLGAYGRSKLGGEVAVAFATGNHVILRTAWVYSPFGTNFVRTMLRLATTRPEIRVVADQRGCPTSALDMADGIIRIVRSLVAEPEQRKLRGTFHLAGTGDTTWADFAEAIFTASAARGGPAAAVIPIATADYPTPAHRPGNSRLACGKLAQIHSVILPPWRESLQPCVARWLEQGLS